MLAKLYCAWQLAGELAQHLNSTAGELACVVHVLL
jgi:hypothetical protein